MKNLTLLIISLLAVSVFSGCQDSANTTVNNSAANTVANNTTAANISTPAANSNASSAPTSSLKPEDLSADKPVPVGDLMDAVNPGTLDTWKGKEVTVIGRYLNNAPTKDVKSGKTSYSVNVARPNTWDIAVVCETDKEPPKEYTTQQENRVFKGTILRNFSSGQVVLENCQYVK